MNNMDVSLILNLNIFFLTLAVLAIIFLYLSINVIRHRVKVQALYGSHSDVALKAAMRAQGNFAEYVPLTMLMFLGLMYFNISTIVFFFLCLILVLARTSHLVGLLKYERREPPYLKPRQFGIFANFFLIIFCILYYFIKFLFY